QASVPHGVLPSFPTRRSSDLGIQLDHEADGVGDALPQAAARLVGDVTQFLGRLEHTLARRLADIRAPVQRAGYRSDRNAKVLREPLDSVHPGPSWRALYTASETFTIPN